MGFFYGHHDRGIDKKGRVSIPPAYKTALGDDLSEGVFAFPSVEPGEPCVEVWPAQRMARLVEKMDLKFEQMTPQQRQVSEWVVMNACPLSVEDTGRIQPPAELLRGVGIDETAIFAGRGATFTMWAPDRFHTHLGTLGSVRQTGAGDALRSIVSG